MNLSRSNGDAWRWQIGRHPRPTVATISVIDGPEREEAPANAHHVPFGFGVRKPTPEATPLLWEGDQS